MVKIIFAIFLMFTISVNSSLAQAKNEAVLTVIGQGKTIDDAHTNALRSAIEQSFGAFISSKTQILNSKLLNDEIVSISNGNVQKYEIISDNQLPDGSYVSTIRATVSIEKLTTFCSSKGMVVEFQGGLFAQNMALQNLNKQNEIKSWENTKKLIYEIMLNGFEYKLNVGTPVSISNDYYSLSINIDISVNKNFETAMKLLIDFCNSVSMSNSEIENYSKVRKYFFPLVVLQKPIYRSSNNYDVYFNQNHTPKKGSNPTEYNFRNESVVIEILSIPLILAKLSLNNFTLENSIKSLSLSEYLKSEPCVIKIKEIGYPYYFKWISFNQSSTGIMKGIYLPSNNEPYEKIEFLGKKTRSFYDQNLELWKDYYQKKEFSFLFSDLFGLTDNEVKYQKKYYEKYPPINFIRITDFLNVIIDIGMNIEDIKRLTEYRIEKNKINIF